MDETLFRDTSALMLKESDAYLLEKLAMTKQENRQPLEWLRPLGSWATVTTVLLTALPVMADSVIVPDDTLGPESSLVTPGDGATDRIEGGATRGSNLFHSFMEFNVGDGQQVYFANPSGIQSILSRITGNNPSHILGTLGVDGPADLFLLNPNGILFGENAALDIEGSFYATTAEAVSLGNEVFRATAPEQSQLLSVSPSALFANYLTDTSGPIQNRGQLFAGKDVTLAASQLDLQGQVVAGGDLTLLASDAVRIRDTAATPFIAFAGANLQVQADQQVDIVALSHADSGLYAGGDLVLRSANPVAGDAHYWSGGDFRVETLDGNPGDLWSPVDPIIRTFGDVTLGQYFGSSLHILAGGSVILGTAVITAPDAGTVGVDFLQETLTLSDGTTVQIDGSAQPTLDVRAGVSPDSIGIPPLETITGLGFLTDFLVGTNLTQTPSSANITLGDAFINAPDGLVLLTNQYQANPQVPGGNIQVASPGNGGIVLEGSAANGTILLDARNDITVVDSFITTSGGGDVGDIKLIAQNDALIDNSVVRSTLRAGTVGNGGTVEIIANRLLVTNDTALATSSFGTGNAGDILLTATEAIIFDGDSVQPGFQTGAFSNLQEGATGTGGDIIIDTHALTVRNGATLVATTEGRGDAGNIVIMAEGAVVFDGFQVDEFGQLESTAFTSVRPGAQGNGGNLEITADSLTVSNQAQLLAEASGTGNAGNLTITTRGGTTFDTGFAFVSVADSASGDGGDLNITASSLRVLNGSQLLGITEGNGNAGNVQVTVSEGAVVDGTDSGIFTVTETIASGEGGDIDITAQFLEFTNAATISAASNSAGRAGDIRIIAEGGIFGSDATISASTSDQGPAGDIIVNTDTLTLTNEGNILAQTTGQASAGTLILQPYQANLTLEVLLASGAEISASTSGSGNGGDLRVLAPEAITLTGPGTLAVETSGTGRAGSIDITSQNLTLADGVTLSASTNGAGQAGDIRLNVTDTLDIDGAFVSSSTGPDSTGPGGNITIDPREVSIRNGGRVAVNSAGQGQGGNITLVGGQLTLNSGAIVGETVSTDGGNISLSLQDGLLMRDNSLISATAGTGQAGGDGGNIAIEVADGFIIAVPEENSDITANAFEGNGGNITITARGIFGLEFRDQLTPFSDITASSEFGFNGNVLLNTPDSSAIENNLAELSVELVNPDVLTASSCIARGTDAEGSFVVTGAGGLPLSPQDASPSYFPTTAVESIPTETAEQPRWQPGDPIVEPAAVFPLADGRMVLSRMCHRSR